jgi:hypothetical protein
VDFLIKNGGSFHSFCESLPEARKTWKPGKQAFLLVTEGWGLGDVSEGALCQEKEWISGSENWVSWYKMVYHGKYIPNFR